MDTVTLLKVFPNEMEALLWVGILEDEGIRALVKPHGVGYGGWGQTAFVPHGVYVLTEHIENARRIIQTSEEVQPQGRYPERDETES